MSAKAKLLVRGSIMGMSNFFASAIIGIMLMPFMIHSLGDRMYGLWVIVGSLLGVYSLFNFGLVPTIQRYISKEIGREDWGQVNKVINTSLFLFSSLGLIALFITIILIVVAPHFVRSSAEINLFRQIIFILGINTALSFPMRVFSGVLVSHVRYDIYTFVELLKLLARSALVVIFLKIGYGILALALISTGVEVLGYIIRLILTKRLYKYIVFSLRLIDLKLLKPLFKYSSVSFAIQIADELNSKVSNFVIAGFIGLSFVTIYAVAANLITYFSNFIASAVCMMMPVFSQYEGKGDYDSIREKYKLMTKISGYLSILVGGCFVIFGRVFIERWMGEKYLSAYPILVILVISSTLYLMQKPSEELLYGISKHRFLAVTNIISVIIKLILSIILVRRFGLIGIAIASAIPGLILHIFVKPIYICNNIKLDINEFYFKIIAPIILKSISIFLIFWLLCKSFITPNYLNLAILASFECLLFASVIFFIGFDKRERGYFIKVALHSR